MNNLKVTSKRGQMTIYIIAGVLIVGLIIFFLILKTGEEPDTPAGTPPTNPDMQIDSCSEEKIIEAVNIISAQGGFISNPLNVTLNDGDVAYLCYNQNYYKPCINQEPVLIKHLNEEIKNYVASDVENCVRNFGEDLEDKNYDVELKYNDFEVYISPGKVTLKIDAKIKYSKSGEIREMDGINSVVQTNFYDNAILVQEIISQEARFCNFEQLGYMLLHPEYDIDKMRLEDGSIVYEILDERTDEIFKFAVRSCAIPPGL